MPTINLSDETLDTLRHACAVAVRTLQKEARDARRAGNLRIAQIAEDDATEINVAAAVITEFA